ncbi:MAG: ferrous iron transport protein A [Coleofasciculus sp. S288]|nr:ferrous iron transport protein A [Coleofasciculus sp. S288]
MDCNNNCNNPKKQNEKLKGWKFTFFGESSEIWQYKEDFDEISQKGINQASFPLAMTKGGDRVWIVGFRGKEDTRHLLSLGLTPGSELKVVNCTSSGSVIVAVQDNRIGLGASIAQKILVTDSMHHIYTSGTVKATNLITYLRDLPIGCRGRVVGYDSRTGGYKGRLLAMGLKPGTEFTVIRHAPFGDIELEVQGFKLRLRKHEADVLCIEEVNDNDD